MCEILRPSRGHTKSDRSELCTQAATYTHSLNALAQGDTLQMNMETPKRCIAKTASLRLLMAGLNHQTAWRFCLSVAALPCKLRRHWLGLSIKAGPQLRPNSSRAREASPRCRTRTPWHQESHGPLCLLLRAVSLRLLGIRVPCFMVIESSKQQQSHVAWHQGALFYGPPTNQARELERVPFLR